jgi:glycogen operon protein
MFNAGTDATDFELPPPPQGLRWHRAIDTSGAAPRDLLSPGEEELVDDAKPYSLGARSSAVLLAR